MDLGLKNKIAMVGGASKGLGYAVARALAAEGASVSMASRDHEAIRGAAGTIQRETGSRAIAVAADLSTADAIGQSHAATLREFGGVDLLFCNTGGPPAGAALSFDDAAWQAAFESRLPIVVRLVRLGGSLAVRCRVVHHRSVGAGRWGFDQGCSLMPRLLIADFRFLIGCRFELQWDRSQSAINQQSTF